VAAFTARERHLRPIGDPDIAGAHHRRQILDGQQRQRRQRHVERVRRGIAGGIPRRQGQGVAVGAKLRQIQRLIERTAGRVEIDRHRGAAVQGIRKGSERDAGFGGDGAGKLRAGGQGAVVLDAVRRQGDPMTVSLEPSLARSAMMSCATS
jgi:hypothetical protein